MFIISLILPNQTERLHVAYYVNLLFSGQVMLFIKNCLQNHNTIANLNKQTFIHFNLSKCLSKFTPIVNLRKTDFYKKIVPMLNFKITILNFKENHQQITLLLVTKNIKFVCVIACWYQSGTAIHACILPHTPHKLPAAR